MLEFKYKYTNILLYDNGTIVATRIINSKLYAIKINKLSLLLSDAVTKINKLGLLDNEMFCLLSEVDKI